MTEEEIMIRLKEEYALAFQENASKESKPEDFGDAIEAYVIATMQAVAKVIPEYVQKATQQQR